MPCSHLTTMVVHLAPSWKHCCRIRAYWCENVALISHVTKSQQARDAKANDESRGIMNAAAVAVWKDWAAKARKFRSHLLWLTGVRRRVAATESDNKADMVLSQGGTSITSVVRYQHKSHDYGRRYSSAIGVQRCCDRSCYQ